MKNIEDMDLHEEVKLTMKLSKEEHEAIVGKELADFFEGLEDEELNSTITKQVKELDKELIPLEDMEDSLVDDLDLAMKNLREELK